MRGREILRAAVRGGSLLVVVPNLTSVFEILFIITLRAFRK
jgi:hypothetical protein